MPTRSPRFRTATALLSLLVAGTVALSGCAPTPSGEGSADAAWSFTDDLGVTVTLDHAPKRVAGLTDILATLMDYGVEPIASFGQFSLEDDGRFDAFDTSGIAQVGTSYGEIDLEALALAKPDIIVNHIYPIDEDGTIEDDQLRFDFKDLAQQQQVEKIAPLVTIYMGGEGEKVIERTADLAVALGADPDVIAATKDDFDKAAEQLTAAAEKSKVQVTVMYADADGVYIVKAADEPTTQLYSDLGVKFTQPTPEGYYWGIYSWENATEIGGDAVLLSKDGYQRDELLKQKTLAGNAALTADQVHTWGLAPMDYAAQADYMTELADWLGTVTPL